MKESLLILVCLLTSLLGLALIYLASISLKPAELELSQIDARLIGKTVKTGGAIAEKRWSRQGHLFLTISDNKTKVQVPLFRSFLEALGKKLDIGQLKAGVKISVVGTVDEYMGQLQIIPRKPEDIEIG